MELNGRLYFLSQNGFCVYSGGYPTVISDCITLDHPAYKGYTSAIGGTDGRKIYFYAKPRLRDKELLVYDTMLNMWHKEDKDNDVLCFFRYNGELYFVQGTDNQIYGPGLGYANCDWYFKTREYNTAGTDYTKLSEVIIYAKPIYSNVPCTMKVYVLYDEAPESEKVDCGSFTIESSITQRISIKINPFFSFTLAVEGTGPVIIKGIEHIYTAGGKNDGNRR